MMRAAVIALALVVGCGARPTPTPRPVDCEQLASDVRDETELATLRGDRVDALIVSGRTVFACPCGARVLAGETEPPPQAQRSLAGASEDRTLGGASEDRSLAGASEDRSLAGASEDRSLAGETQDRSLAGASEDRSLAGASEDRSLAGARGAAPSATLSCYFESGCDGYRIQGVRAASTYDGALHPLRTTCVPL